MSNFFLETFPDLRRTTLFLRRGFHMAARAFTLAAEARGQVYRVCFTGGPCSGKRTAISSVRRRLNNLGFRVFTVPEAATMMFTSGAQVDDLIADPLTFQSALLNSQLALEDTFDFLARGQAERGISSVIVCERGAMDNKASTPPEHWQDVIESTGYQTESDLREGRYDLVLHLVTAADGAEEFYVEDNSRGGAEESIEEARALDRRVRECWIGHERLHIMDNSGANFDAKMRVVMDRVSALVGAPRAPGASRGRPSAKRKFVLRGLPDLDALPVDLRTAVTDISTTYLARQLTLAQEEEAEETAQRMKGSWLAAWSTPVGGSTSSTRGAAAPPVRPKVRRQRVRLRGTAGAFSPVLQTWWSSAGEIRSHMTEKAISMEEYSAALERRDPDSATVNKQLTSFAWGGKGGEVLYWEIHHFTDSGTLLLEVDAPVRGEGSARDEADDIQLPSFLDIDREVTADSSFSTYRLAQEWQSEYILRDAENNQRFP
jgi:hypothetical protein